MEAEIGRKVNKMSSRGYLFVTEDVAHELTEEDKKWLDKHTDKWHIQVPDNFYGVNIDKKLPKEGKAPILNDKEQQIATLNWETEFTIEYYCYREERHIKAIPKRVRIEKEAQND